MSKNIHIKHNQIHINKAYDSRKVEAKVFRGKSKRKKEEKKEGRDKIDFTRWGE